MTAPLPLVSDDDATEDQRAALRSVLETRGRIPVFARLVAHSSTALDAYETIARQTREESSLEPLVRELVTLRLAQVLSNEFEWRMHFALARDSGASDEQLRNLARWEAAGDLFPGRVRAALAHVDSTLAAGAADGVALTEWFQPAEIVDLGLLIGTHCAIAAIMSPFSFGEHVAAPEPTYTRAGDFYDHP